LSLKIWWEHGQQNRNSHTDKFASSADKTYYVDAVNGNDNNDGLTAGTAFQTFAKAKPLIPKFLLHNLAINIIGNIAEDLTVSDVIIAYGKNLSIQGSTGVAANHTVTGAGQIAGVIGGTANNMGAILLGLTFTQTITLVGCDAFISACNPRKSGDAGIKASNARVRIISCDFGSGLNTICIQAVYNSKVISTTNTGNGTQYGLDATRNSEIGKESTQPTGTSANEHSVFGGVIR
jgi:hypothetical protein